MNMNHENENEIQNVNPQTEQENPAAEQVEESAAAENTAAENTAQVDTDALPADPQVEPVTEPEKENKPKQHKFKEFTGSAKFRRGSISTAFTAGFIVIIVLLNVIVSILGQRFPSMNLDLTKNSSNTLSEQAIKVVNSVKAPVTLYILATEEATKNDQILSEYGIQYSQVGILASKMAERNPNIKVQYIDLVKNPTFAAQYKSDNVTEGDVIVKSDKRDRVITYTELFNVEQGQDGSSNTYSLVDSALASGVNSVIADSLPVVAFDNGHQEQLDATTYKSLLANNNFETKDFNLLTDAIPDKTQMIVLGCPTSDYTDEEIKKLDTFLGSTTLAGDRTLMITFHPSQQEMPKLATFLKEWGIEVPQAVVVESDQSKYYTSDPSYILSNIQTTLDIGTKTDYGYFTMPQSNPINLLFTAKENKTTYVLAKSNDTCYLVDNSTKSANNPTKAAYNTAVLTQDSVKSGDKTYKANVIAMGSTQMFSSQIMAANTFGNGKYLVDLSKYATGTSNTDTAVVSNSVQTNVADITLSAQASTLLGFGVFTVLIPLLIALAGILVYHKRRHL